MALNRRRFLQAGGAAAVLGTAGCDAPQQALWPYTGLPGEAKLPFAPPGGGSIDLVSHLLNRLSYGARPGQHGRILRLAKREEEAAARFIDEQLAPEKINDDRAEFRVQRFETLALAPIGEFYEFQPGLLREELTRATLTRAVYSERQLQEVMVRFWSDHFNIDISKCECKWLKPADDRDVIRPHALGRFPDLLAASAKSQAMLTYLDGRANRVRQPGDQPNENYARELLELHTLGVRGGYTQRARTAVTHGCHAAAVTHLHIGTGQRRHAWQHGCECTRLHEHGEDGGGLRQHDGRPLVASPPPQVHERLAAAVGRRSSATVPLSTKTKCVWFGERGAPVAEALSGEE